MTFKLLFYLLFASIMNSNLPANNSTLRETATLGGGCFWCMEAAYQQLKGVISVTSGYAGGTTANPTYEEVCSGRTGHAEVVQVVFDPTAISYRDIIDFFWEAHNPTTRNRQGADVGSQYRSIILYANPEQKSIAEASLREAQKRFDQPIVTEIVPLAAFYQAEKYHQDYYNRNASSPYCRAVITPKLQKLKKYFQE